MNVDCDTFTTVRAVYERGSTKGFALRSYSIPESKLYQSLYSTHQMHIMK